MKDKIKTKAPQGTDTLYTLDGTSFAGATAQGLAPEVVVDRLRTLVRNVYRANVDDAQVADAHSVVSIRNVEQLLAQTLKTEFAPRYASADMPIGSYGVRPFARTYLQRIMTRRGMLDYVTSADMPMTDVEASEVSRNVYTVGGKVGWSYFELEEARTGGQALNSEKLEALSEIAEDTRDEILLRGDGRLKRNGLIPTGFYNDPQVPVAPSGQTFEQLYSTSPTNVINAVLEHLKQQTKAVADRYPADTLLLPTDAFQVLLRPRGEGTDTSLRNWLLTNTPLTTIASRPMLEGMGDSDTDRAILYRKNERIVRGVVPLPFQPLPPETRLLQTEIMVFERIAGCEIRLPAGVLYVDGV